MHMRAFEPAIDSRIVDHLILRANRLALVGGCPAQVIVSVELRECDDRAQQQTPPPHQLIVRLPVGDGTADHQHESMALLFRCDRLQVPTCGHAIWAEVTKNSHVQSAGEGHVLIA